MRYQQTKCIYFDFLNFLPRRDRKYSNIWKRGYLYVDSEVFKTLSTIRFWKGLLKSLHSLNNRPYFPIYQGITAEKGVGGRREKVEGKHNVWNRLFSEPLLSAGNVNDGNPIKKRTVKDEKCFPRDVRGPSLISLTHSASLIFQQFRENPLEELPTIC